MYDDKPLCISVASSRKSTTWEAREVSWGALCKRLSRTQYTEETEADYATMPKESRVNCKDVGGLLCGKLRGGQRRNSDLEFRSVLALDIDYGTPDVWEDYELLCDWECLMHTTHSHTREHPRLRMFFPLARPVTKDEYEPIGRMIASMIDIELFDDTTFQSARLMFWPSTPSDGEFKVWHHSGEWVDPDEVLALYDDWKDTNLWPVSVRNKETIKRSIKDKQADPRQKLGIVGAFCQVYDIPAAIETYLPDVYVPTEDPNRYTYTGGSTVGGLVLYEDGLFCYSHHDTDPAHGRTCNAFDLVRLHKRPETDERASYDGMKTFLHADEKVQAKLEEMINGVMPFDPTNLTEEDLNRSKYDFTETGNSLRLKDRYGEVMRYNLSLGWCVWNGQIWLENAESSAMLNVMRLNDIMLQQAANLVENTTPEKVDEMRPKDFPKDYEQALAYYAWAKKSRSNTTTKHVLDFSKATFGMTATDDFDPDPWELNTPTGIINLKTGETSPLESWHMCTMSTSVSPSWTMDHDMWDEFLNRVTCGDVEFQRYLQRLAGMALVGEVYEENLVMVCGSGSNGKSTLFKIWATLAGTYAGTVRNEVLLGNRFGTDVAGLNQLKGKRLIIASELEKSTPLSSALMKRLVSRDLINANVKFKEPITFKPSHTLILHTNYLPRLTSNDHGTLRRIAIAPFNSVIEDGEKRPNFAQEILDAEGPAILAWMIDGAVDFFNEGMNLRKPKVVLEATQAYFDSEDLVRRFISECCLEEGSANSGDLFSAFRQWLHDNDMRWSGGSVAFKKDLEGKGFECKRTNKNRIFVGLSLVDEGDEL